MFTIIYIVFVIIPFFDLRLIHFLLIYDLIFSALLNKVNFLRFIIKNIIKKPVSNGF